MCQRRYKCLHCGAEDVETLPELKSYMHPFLLPLLLPPRYINTIHRLYESVSMLSGSQSCLHSLPCIISLPPLFFSDTEKLTPPPPSLLACFCPPYSSGRQHRTLFFFFFFLTRSRCNIMSSICIFSVQSPPPATQLNISIRALPSLVSRCCTFSAASQSLNHCWCCPAASAENWFCLQIHCMLLCPSLFIVHSISGSLPLSLSITPWEPTFFFSSTQYFMLPFSASPTPRFLLSVPLFPHFSVHLFLSLALIRLREEFTIVYPACEWISKNLFFLICLVHTVGRQLCIFTLSLVNLVRVQSGALERDWSGWCWWWSALEVRPSYEVSEGLDSANPR